MRSPLFVLFLLFLTLKLCGVIAWAWVWVFAPLWIPLALVTQIFVIAVLVGVIQGLLPGSKKGG